MVFEDGKGLCEEISEVVGTGNVLNAELPQPNTVAYPIQAHVDGLGSSGLDGVAGETYCDLIVA